MKKRKRNLEKITEKLDGKLSNEFIYGVHNVNGSFTYMQTALPCQACQVRITFNTFNDYIDIRKGVINNMNFIHNLYYTINDHLIVSIMI